MSHYFFFFFQTELSQALQQLSERAKVATDFIHTLKTLTDDVHVSYHYIWPSIHAFCMYKYWTFYILQARLQKVEMFKKKMQISLFSCILKQNQDLITYKFRLILFFFLEGKLQRGWRSSCCTDWCAGRGSSR